MFLELSLLLALGFYLVLYLMEQSKRRKEDSEKINRLTSAMQESASEIRLLKEEIKQSTIPSPVEVGQRSKIGHLEPLKIDTSECLIETSFVNVKPSEKTPIQKLIELKTGVVSERLDRSSKLIEEGDLYPPEAIGNVRPENFPYYRIARALSTQRGWRIEIVGHLVCVHKGNRKYYATTNEELIDIFKQ